MKATVAILAAFSILFAVSADAAVKIDPSFAPVIASPGTVAGIVPLPSGQALIFGSFTSINGVSASHIARINSDGTADTSFRLPSDLDVVQIMSAAVQADGKILIGGYITLYGTNFDSQQYLFRLNPDGSLDSSLNAGGYSSGSSFGLNAPVKMILPEADGKVLVCGDFTSPYSRIARLNSDGTADNTFNLGAGANGEVLRMARQSTGNIVIAGRFSKVAGISRGRIAILSPSGALVGSADFGGGISYGDVLALAVQPDDKILAGGTFQQILYRYHPDGTPDTGFNPFVRGRLHEVTCLLTLPGYVLVGGWNPVMYFGGKPTDHNASIYALSSLGGGFSGYVDYRGKPTDLLAIALRSDGKILAGGSFFQREGPVDYGFYPGLALFHLGEVSLQPVASFRPVIGDRANIQSLKVQPDGKVLAAGDFTWVNGLYKPSLGRLNPDGTTDDSFAPPDLRGAMALSLRDDGKILAGGSFSIMAGDEFGDLVLMNPDGSIALTGQATSSRELLFQPDGKIIAIGPWYPGVRRLNPDLTPDTGFDPGVGITNQQQPDFQFDRANRAAVQPDGKILVAGSFSTFNGIERHNIVRLAPDGSVDTGFVGPRFTVFNYRTELFALAVQKDGKILVGGRFSAAGGHPTPSIARLNANGSIDTTFTSTFQASGSNVFDIALEADGHIIVGGDMWRYQDGIHTRNLARVRPDGDLDLAFTAAVDGSRASVNRIALLPGDRLLAAGSFDQADALPRYSMARYRLSLFDLGDVIRTLRAITGSGDNGFDADGDGKTGLSDAIILLQKIGAMR